MFPTLRETSDTFLCTTNTINKYIVFHVYCYLKRYSIMRCSRTHLIFVVVFGFWFWCVTLYGVELKPSFFSLTDAGITGVHHYAWPHFWFPVLVTSLTNCVILLTYISNPASMLAQPLCCVTRTTEGDIPNIFVTVTIMCWSEQKWP